MQEVKSPFNASMRAAGMVLVVGVCTHIIHNYVIEHAQDFIGSAENSACLVVVGLIMYLLLCIFYRKKYPIS